MHSYFILFYSVCGADNLQSLKERVCSQKRGDSGNDVLHVVQIVSNNAWGDLRLSKSVFATAARKNYFNSKFTAKMDFLIGHLCNHVITIKLKLEV